MLAHSYISKTLISKVAPWAYAQPVALPWVNGFRIEVKLEKTKCLS